HILRILILDPLWQKIKSAQDNYRLVSILLTLGMFFTGCTWAVIPLFYLNEPQSETFIFISIALAGMICATLPALAAFLPAYLAFVAPIFTALVMRYFQLGMISTALLTLCFLGAMVGISYIINKIITRSITIDLNNENLLREVTEAKEKAEQANRAKSRFMAAASHDLRQPLQALGLLLESLRLRTGNNDPMLKPLVSQSIDAHSALSALLNALLELSRLESHTLDINKITLPVKDMVNAISNEFQPAAKLKGLSLETKGEDYFVRTDPILFGRVLRNLLSNAIKFTHTGKITVRFNRLENDVVLSVIDTGIGIPSSEQDKIFDEYYQVSNEARNRNEGIGLGLSVVKK
ncbi:MAG TPA: HAMP domain-containing sensor histidine kinase, partial [Pseudomonadales bacterium]|nr:HAMP domain-containing sensor histidine kinase [Pseudomonadales bacterium]